MHFIVNAFFVEYSLHALGAVATLNKSLVFKNIKILHLIFYQINRWILFFCGEKNELPNPLFASYYSLSRHCAKKNMIVEGNDK